MMILGKDEPMKRKNIQKLIQPRQFIVSRKVKFASSKISSAVSVCTCAAKEWECNY